MRELSDASARHQAIQFIAYASKGAQLDAFERWASSKDLGPEDRAAIQAQVAALFMRGER